jgi:uncharacterized protein (DUF1015 family)
MLLGKDMPGEDKYHRAMGYFRDWLKDRIFIQDASPAIYFYSQQYSLKGQKRTRLGFISLLQLDEDGRSSTFGHEHTHLEPKEDRLKLLRAVKANLSPIFVVFLDRKRIIQRTYEQYLKDKKPFIDIVDDEKIVHKAWRLDSRDILEKIQNQMRNENIFIADGHHRYEVACVYRDKMRQRLGALTQEEPFNYIMAYFTNLLSSGLTILPIHRLVKLAIPLDIDKFKNVLKDYFALEEIKDKARLFFLMEKAGSAEHVLGMYKDNKYYLLRLKNIKILDRMISDKPPEFRSLDVSVLNYLILKNILGITLEDKENLSFSNDAEELIRRVDNNNLYIAFFLNPARIQQVVSISLSGEKMPPKSTYFYPKVLSGLVINKF